MKTGLHITFDSLTPGLAKLAAVGASPTAVLEVGAVELQNVTVEAFGSPGVRPHAWPDKKSGGPSNLTDSTTLRHSIALGPITRQQASVQTDRPYAAVHQFGSNDGSIPARPFFPFLGGTITTAAHRRIEAVMQLKLNALLQRGA